MTMPIGFRKGHAAVRNAELQLSRERSLLEQTERDIAHDFERGGRGSGTRCT